LRSDPAIAKYQAERGQEQRNFAKFRLDEFVSTEGGAAPITMATFWSHDAKNADADGPANKGGLGQRRHFRRRHRPRPV
jgi:hypothetical protein